MKIRLADYKEGVATGVQQEYNPRELDLEFIDLEYTKPLVMRGTVEKGSDTVTFRGNLFSEIDHICGRCLKRKPERVDQPFELYYETQGLESIETIDDLREVLILDHPISYLCQENCMGLCLTCGTNLNDAKCSCAHKEKPEAARGAFDQLKQLLEKKQEKT